MLSFIINIWVINTQRYKTRAAYGGIILCIKPLPIDELARAQTACTILKSGTFYTDRL
jgi:hypothetical protein